MLRPSFAGPASFYNAVTENNTVQINVEHFINEFHSCAIFVSVLERTESLVPMFTKDKLLLLSISNSAYSGTTPQYCSKLGYFQVLIVLDILKR